MEKLTKSKDRVAKYGEVFTPDHIVKQMCDMLHKENPEQDVFAPDTTFLEPSCGEGAFILEVLRRKFANCNKRSDYIDSLESVYGFELLADNVATAIKNVIVLCEEHFKVTDADRKIISDHIIQCDALKILKLLKIYGENPPDQIKIYLKEEGVEP